MERSTLLSCSGAFIIIEMALWNTLGDFLEDSGWTTALCEAEVASSGTADSFLRASHLTKTLSKRAKLMESIPPTQVCKSISSKDCEIIKNLIFFRQHYYNMLTEHSIKLVSGLPVSAHSKTFRHLRDLGGHDMVRGGNQSGLIFLRWRKHV